MTNEDDGLTFAAPQRQPRALKDIGYNNLIYDTSNTSSGDDLSDVEGVPSKDARRVLDVSFGPQHSRLTSPQTPALERAAAIEEAGGFFGDGVEDAEREPADDSANISTEAAHAEAGAQQPVFEANPQELKEDTEDRRAEAEAAEAREARKVARSPAKTNARLPSPWRAVPRRFQRSDQTRQFLRDGLRFNRRRGSSDSESGSGWRSALPKMPNFSSMTPFSSSNNDGANEADTEGRALKRSSRSGSFLTGSFQWPSRTSSNHADSETSSKRERSSSYARHLRRVSSPPDPEEVNGTVGDLPTRPELASLRSRKTYLRRSASDDSLTTARTMSRASSLGDDTRFTDVSAQVNNRMKAIKDSWADDG